jgi:serine phosphatase RsbU (regulator of sigma subunit)
VKLPVTVAGSLAMSAEDRPPMISPPPGPSPDLPPAPVAEPMQPVLESIAATGWRLLLVEDDDGDAILVNEMLADGLPGALVERVSTLAAAVRRAPDAECVLLDVGLPDAEGTHGVEKLTAAAPHAAVVVLTGADSERLGVASVMAGAQDYLVKSRVDEDLLVRSVRYAIERQRAARLSRDLFDAERRRAENTRVERALTPTPVISSADITVDLRYQARREGSELGGDFYDAVELAGGELHMLIGDVAGHGPDEAALAARLRSAWRALTLAGLDQVRAIGTLDTFIRTEWHAVTFATVCTLVIGPDRSSARLVLAGHPPPILVGDGSRVVGADGFGPLLGVLPDPTWRPVDVALGPGAVLLLYTDGLFEGHASPGRPMRLGIDSLLPIIDDFHRMGTTGTELLDGLLAEALRRNGGPLADDVALCLVSVAR